MPPFVGRKRRSTSPLPEPAPTAKRAKTKTTNQPAPTLKKKLSRFTVDSSSDSSSLSDIDSDEFEDIPRSSKAGKGKGKETRQVVSEDEDDDEDEVFEDAPAHKPAIDLADRVFKDVNVTMQDQPDLEPTMLKKGPLKKERQARLWAHQMHVQFLLWHNAKRNEWLNDKRLHEVLLKQLPAQLVKEIEKWRRASGLASAQEQPKQSPKDKKKIKKWKANGDRNERDWGRPSQKLEEGKPDMSHGDPIISLLKVLAAYWKRRFAITAPGLRKRGWSSRAALQKDVTSYRKEKHHPAKHGEKIESLEDYVKLADKAEGSRDVGAQLFTALLRAIGMEARVVASLQPTGYGFSKAEEMVPRKIIDPESSSENDEDESKKRMRQKSRKTVGRKATKHSSKGSAKSKPIELDDEDDQASTDDDDDDSVIDVTPSLPKPRAAKYDKDLPFPIYWAEAVSPITHKVYPVSAFCLENAVATSVETLAAFEPRGAKADKARQVMAYVVAFSPNYSAKDVTVRYLRKNIWPGKTKGFRVPIEKVPIYDKHGRIKRHVDYDWFADALRPYGQRNSQRTAVDDLEDSEDLVPADSEKKVALGDTLHSLKTSAEFIIERHLRREEALIPAAVPVRYFTVGKGNKEEKLPIFKRSDVRRVMTAESWHKDGRIPREGEAPMKLAPVRAVTATRKREAEEHLLRTGEKQMQGLYSEDQTDWIIPPPIEDGKIPKNAYGNIDCFVPSMVPEGAVHLPLKGSVRICKKLEIDYAEAVVGFEFGNKMAVPVINGVVVAEENETLVTDAWKIWHEEQQRKEENKQEALVLETWRKMMMALRIRTRVQEDYGVEIEAPSNTRGTNAAEPIEIDNEDQAGGFMPEGEHDDHHEEAGGFLVDHDEEDRHVDELTFDFNSASQEKAKNDLLDSDGDVDASQGYPTPMSDPPSTREAKFAIEALDDGMSNSPLSSDSKQTPALTKPNPSRGKAVGKVDTPAPRKSKKPEKVNPSPADMQKRKTRSPRSAPSGTGKITPTSQTRRTPARSAKKTALAKVLIEDSSDEENHTVSSDPEDLNENEPVDPAPKKRTRGRPKMEQQVQSARSNGMKGRRLLRRESTIVTSPYFED